MVTVGLDLSLAKTGYTVMCDGVVKFSGIIKSQPSGDKHIDELKRLIKIVDQIEVMTFQIGKPDIVAIENLAFMARNTTALTQLAGLSYFVRQMLLDNNIPFLMVAPLTLKKFVTGKGKGDKSLMLMTVYKDYGFESLDDNVCDAFGLAALSMAVLGSPILKPGVPQIEVIELIKKQIC